MPPTGFEPAIPANERPQTDALDPAAIGNGTVYTKTGVIQMRGVTSREGKCPPKVFLPTNIFFLATELQRGK